MDNKESSSDRADTAAVNGANKRDLKASGEKSSGTPAGTQLASNPDLQNTEVPPSQDSSKLQQPQEPAFDNTKEKIVASDGGEKEDAMSTSSNVPEPQDSRSSVAAEVKTSIALSARVAEDALPMAGMNTNRMAAVNLKLFFKNTPDVERATPVGSPLTPDSVSEHDRADSPAQDDKPRQRQMASKSGTPTSDHSTSKRSRTTDQPGSPQTIVSERRQLALLKQQAKISDKSQSPETSFSRDRPPTPSGSSTSSTKEMKEARSVNRRDGKGETPLHLACRKGDLGAVKKLLDDHADVNATDNAGWTPLHEAANHGRDDVTKILIKNGANIHARGLDGVTPLMDAVTNGRVNGVKILLKAGADPKSENDKGQTCLQLTESDEIRSFLNKHMKETDEKQNSSVTKKRHREEEGGKMISSDIDGSKSTQSSKKPSGSQLKVESTSVVGKDPASGHYSGGHEERLTPRGNTRNVADDPIASSHAHSIPGFGNLSGVTQPFFARSVSPHLHDPHGHAMQAKPSVMAGSQYEDISDDDEPKASAPGSIIKPTVSINSSVLPPPSHVSASALPVQPPPPSGTAGMQVPFHQLPLVAYPSVASVLPLQSHELPTKPAGSLPIISTALPSSAGDVPKKALLEDVKEKTEVKSVEVPVPAHAPVKAETGNLSVRSGPPVHEASTVLSTDKELPHSVVVVTPVPQSLKDTERTNTVAEGVISEATVPWLPIVTVSPPAASAPQLQLSDATGTHSTPQISVPVVTHKRISPPHTSISHSVQPVTPEKVQPVTVPTIAVSAPTSLPPVHSVSTTPTETSAQQAHVPVRVTVPSVPPVVSSALEVLSLKMPPALPIPPLSGSSVPEPQLPSKGSYGASGERKSSSEKKPSDSPGKTKAIPSLKIATQPQQPDRIFLSIKKPPKEGKEAAVESGPKEADISKVSAPAEPPASYSSSKYQDQPGPSGVSTSAEKIDAGVTGVHRKKDEATRKPMTRQRAQAQQALAAGPAKRKNARDDKDKPARGRGKRAAAESSAQDSAVATPAVLSDVQKQKKVRAVAKKFKSPVKDEPEQQHTTFEPPPNPRSASPTRLPFKKRLTIRNEIEEFVNQRRQVEENWRTYTNNFPMKVFPKNCSEYLILKKNYSVASSLPKKLEAPLGLAPELKGFFGEQEEERHALLRQHVIEKDRLIMGAEQEMMRLHQRFCRITAGITIPYSACMIISEQDSNRSFQSQDQDDKSKNATRNRISMRDLIKWLEESDDKYDYAKKEMLTRHRLEAVMLRSKQRMDWSWKLEDLGMVDPSCRNAEDLGNPYIPEIVVEDFVMLPDQ